MGALRRVWVAVFSVWACGALARGEAMDWKVGIGKAALTPEKPVWLAGYAGKRVPEGKLHDLWAKALAFEDQDGHRAVLVATDQMGIPRGMYESTVKKLKERFGLDRAQVMLAFSHNHCGPRLRGDLVDYYPPDAAQEALVADYTDLAEARIVEAVGKALADLAPATLSLGEGAATFAVNRRNNREADVPALLARGALLKGPVDHAVPVLAIRREGGGLAAVLFGYACHPTTLSFTQWCGDYPGFAQLELENAHPGAATLFLNTCGGDQNPIPRRSVELCQRYGHLLAEAVEKVLKQPTIPLSPGLRCDFEFVELSYEKVMTRDDLKPLAVGPNALQAPWATRMLGKLDAGQAFASSYPYPVQAWGLGKELLLIGLGGEAVVDFALRFKKEFGPGTWVCGYANDLVAYIPSRRVWEEGGYEGGPHLDEYGHPALRWAGDVEERVAAAVARLVRSVRR